jgi:hypothetical protein
MPSNYFKTWKKYCCSCLNNKFRKLFIRLGASESFTLKKESPGSSALSKYMRCVSLERIYEMHINLMGCLIKFRFHMLLLFLYPSLQPPKNVLHEYSITKEKCTTITSSPISPVSFHSCFSNLNSLIWYRIKEFKDQLETTERTALVYHKYSEIKKLCGLSSQASCTDRATVACRRSW